MEHPFLVNLTTIIFKYSVYLNFWYFMIIIKLDKSREYSTHVYKYLAFLD